MSGVGWTVQFSRNFFENSNEVVKRNVIGDSKLTGFGVENSKDNNS